MLASDDNNPEFVNAKNPDSMLQIEFSDYAALDKWATEQTGVKTYLKEFPYVRISVPGKEGNEIFRPAMEIDKKKWPQQWLYYQMQTGKAPEAGNIPGWQIKDWREISADQLRELNFKRFYTVEQLAGCSDAQAQGIGMGGFALRTRAQEALGARNQSTAAKMLAERDTELATMKAQMAEMQAMMTQLMPKHGSDAARETMGLPPRGPGRPPKEVSA